MAHNMASSTDRPKAFFISPPISPVGDDTCLDLRAVYPLELVAEQDSAPFRRVENDHEFLHEQRLGMER
jgi:hypothetical protein